MLKFFCSITGRGWALFFVRWILGVVFLLRGFHKTFVMGPVEHAEKFFVDGFAEFAFLPEIFLRALGMAIPVVELVIGAMILIGLRLREALVATGALLIVTTIGHTLQNPFFDINGHTFTYLVMTVFLLMVPGDDDKLTLSGISGGNQ